MKYKTILMGIIILSTIIIGGVLFVSELTRENTVIAKVESVTTRFDGNMERDGLTGSEITHLITTDKGVFKIQPVGFMSSPQFGTIKEGVTYQFTTRGINLPAYRLLPYIIKADSIR